MTTELKHKLSCEYANTDDYVKIPEIKSQKEYAMYSPKIDELHWITAENFIDSYMFYNDYGVFIKAYLGRNFRLYDFYLIGEL
jgi:hypothetical protein